MEYNLDYFSVVDKNGRTLILESGMAGLDSLLKFMRKVSYFDHKAFVFKTRTYEWLNGSTYKKSEYVKASKLADAFGHLRYYAQLFRSEWDYSPLLKLFFEEYRKHPISECECRSPNAITVGDVADGERFNDFINHLRRVGKQVNIKQQVRDWEKGSKQNLDSAMAFEAKLFEKHSRVTVLRLDLNYHKALVEPEVIDRILTENALAIQRDQMAYADGEELSDAKPPICRVSLEEVLSDKDRLLANRRSKPSLFGNLVGYAWAIEYTPVAGYHLHLALFFIGVHKHEWLAQEIGKYLENEITKGRGYFHNCNLDREKYGDQWALGPIEHWDHVKRDSLRVKVLGYLAKLDQRVHVKPHRKCRTFGVVLLGERKPISIKNKGGRPRKVR